MKTKEQQKISYNIVLEAEPEGGFTVTVPAIPGCVTYGETFEEALRMAREAILLCLEDMVENGEPLPRNQPAVLSSLELDLSELHA